MHLQNLAYVLMDWLTCSHVSNLVFRFVDLLLKDVFVVVNHSLEWIVWCAFDAKRAIEVRHYFCAVKWPMHRGWGSFFTLFLYVALDGKPGVLDYGAEIEVRIN